MKITKTKKGNFTTVVHVGTTQLGKKITKRFTAPTKKELHIVVAEYLSNNRIALESHAFSDALDRYITAREALRSPSTIRSYKSMAKALKMRYGSFAELHTDRITDRDVQVIVDDLVRREWSPKTIQNWVGLINAVLIAEKRRPTRPLVPARKQIDREIPSEGEIRMLLCLLHGHKLEIPFQLAILGLRRGEICALTLDDLNQDNVLHIHKARVRGEGGYTVIRDTPKTQASNRFIQLPEDLARRIRSQGYVTRYTLSGLSCAYTDFLRKYKFPPYRLHDCRHFYASYCHAKGVPEADILAGGGWKTSNVMKSVYRHSMARNRATAAVAGLFG